MIEVIQYYILEEKDSFNILNFNITLLYNEWNAIFDEDQRHFKRLDGKNSYRTVCYINEQIYIFRCKELFENRWILFFLSEYI